MNVLIADPFATAGAIAVRPIVRVVIVGHVDHGKSTLIGRLLHETGSLPDGKLENLKAVCARRGRPFEWSFLLDALQTERDQGITLDTSQIRFRTPSRDIVLIDAPGHAEFLRNMITGAAQADAALLVVDAGEGVRDQTRRHGYLLHLLGVRQVAVVVNKLDRIDFDATRFRAIETEIHAHLTGVGLTPAAIIPISARHGDGVVRRTPSIDWYAGPTVLEALDGFSAARAPDELELRFPVQAVYKIEDRRIIAGRVESGRIAIGDEVAVLPSGRVARVQAIEAWPVPIESRSPQWARAGQSIGITLDRELFVERGHVISSSGARPAIARSLRARVFWLAETPLAAGTAITVRIGTAEAPGVIKAVDRAVDPGQLSIVGTDVIAQNHVGEIEIALSKPLAVDPYSINSRTGRLVLDLENRIAGGGLVLNGVNDIPARQDDAGPRSQFPDFTSRMDQSALAAQAARLAKLFSGLSPAERLTALRHEIDGQIVFTTSFGLEDQAIMHLLHEQNVDIEIVTLDTGRLFPETYEVWAETERRYGRRVRAFYPDGADLESLVERQGINGFYDSREARNACCHVRKVAPLNRALANARAWVVGLRADQSTHRGGLDVVVADPARGIVKLSPFFDWTRDAILRFAQTNGVPLNRLHAKGFASIGCAPCTRAIAPGEPERTGRWWWENEDKKECGLHLGHSDRTAEVG